MSKESLRDYKRFCEISAEYIDESGLYEILESAYLRLCLGDSYFNAYTEYSYFNVCKIHRIIFFKQVSIEDREILSELLIDNLNDRYFEIRRIDKTIMEMKGFIDYSVDQYNNPINYTEINKYYLGADAFTTIFNYLKNWFAEILISVKNKEI